MHLSQIVKASANISHQIWAKLKPRLSQSPKKIYGLLEYRTAQRSNIKQPCWRKTANALFLENGVRCTKLPATLRKSHLNGLLLRCQVATPVHTLLWLWCMGRDGTKSRKSAFTEILISLWLAKGLNLSKFLRRYKITYWAKEPQTVANCQWKVADTNDYFQRTRAERKSLRCRTGF